MRALILDPGLVGRHGHHHSYNRIVRDELRRRGVEVRLLAGAGCEAALAAELGAEPCFKIPTYSLVDGTEHDGLLIRHVMMGRGMEADLRAALGDRVGPDDLVLVHTASVHHLLGLLRRYRGLPSPRPAIVFQLMHPPSFGCDPGDRPLAKALLSRALATWRAEGGERWAQATDSAELGGHLAALAGVPPALLPMPVEFPEPPQAPREPGPVLAFGHLGPARVEKGFQEIVQAFAGDRSGLARPVRLALQVTGVEAPGLHARLAEALPSDVLIPGDLSEARYWELLSACDAALLPYDPAAYGIRSSRILVEAVGLGLPVLVTRGTWLDGELERLGGAGLRVGFEADDIRQGVARLAEEMPVLRAKAAEAAPACRSRHSPRAFVDAVLDAAGLGPQK